MSGRSEPISVLYVDDEPDGRDLVATRLERESTRLTVETVSTVAAGMERFSAGAVDCIVSDYHLEASDGVEFLEQVRAESPAFPFILLTQTGNEQVASEAISADVTDYVIKGFAENQYELLAAKIVREVEHRHADQAAQRTKQRLHELAEQTNDSLWMFSGDWSELLFVNATHEELFGQPVELLEANPTAFVDVVHPDDRERVLEGMNRVSEGSSEQITYRIVTNETETRWMESHGEPIFEDGTVARIAGFTRDVTERERNERELRTKNEKLDLFASVVAHDLRNPLNIASGNLELVKQEGSLDRLPPIERSLDRMERLVTDLLTLARQGETIGDRETIALGRLATDHWRTVRTGEATLQVDSQVILPCDRSRLGEAFENLFRNAVEHGGDDVTVTVGRLDDGDGFYVEDDGPGIPEATREQLLAGESPAERGQVKFGVAIVARIIDAHDWTLSITESAEGGARFEVSGVHVVDGA